MANIFDYIHWRQDLSFAASPFNEVDNLILANLAYIHFAGIVESSAVGQPIKLKQAGELFLKQPLNESMYRDKKDLDFIRALIGAPRYQDLQLYHYQERYDHEMQTQFAAMAIRIAPGLTYISYRGTDGFLAGWKENFDSSFCITVAQQMAVAYLDKTGRITRDQFIIGGHSKGGNLAMYAGAFADDNIRKRIIRVYNNDGPGFNFDIIPFDVLKTIKDRLITFTPRFSIVAMIMKQIKEPIIIASDANYVMQHDPYSWQIDGTTFVQENDYDKFSKTLHQAMDRWLEGIDINSREIFIDAVYEIIAATDTHDVNTLLPNLLKNIPAVLRKKKGLDEQTSKIINDSLGELVNALKDSLFTKKNNA